MVATKIQHSWFLLFEKGNTNEMELRVLGRFRSAEKNIINSIVIIYFLK